MSKSIALLLEQKYYESNKAELLKKYPGQFIVIKGEEVLGGFTEQYEAYTAGVEKYGNEPFLVKRVTDLQELPAQTPALWVGSVTAHDS